MRTAIVLVPALLLIALIAPTQTTNPDARIVQPRHAPIRSAPQKPEAAPVLPAPPADRQDVDTLRSDLAHMRVLLNQMRTNLAFVQTSDTPLTSTGAGLHTRVALGRWTSRICATRSVTFRSRSTAACARASPRRRKLFSASDTRHSA